MSPLSKLKTNRDKLILLAILFFLCFRNFTPHTFLIGWDNLLPELDIWLNLKRSFFAVWQEYQGLGLLGGMAHATDLVRQLILLPFILILPTNLIRYLWHFSMLFLGTLGFYSGSKKLFLNYKSYSILPFCSALFYLLNFGSVQLFWHPLETFSAFWGFFPWLTFSLWQYLQKPSPSNLRRLVLFNVLAIPGFYVQTLFVVYLLCLSLIFLAWLLSSSKNLKFKILKSAKIILLILLLNSFWLLPQIYFLSTSLNQPLSGIGNLMSNDQTYARNLNRGHLSDFLLLRGYYYDFPDSQGLMMSPWQIHFKSIPSQAAGYLLSFFVLAGLLTLFFRRRQLNFVDLSLIFLFLLSAFTLLTAIAPFAQINSLLRQLPLINQIFRSPFTKFIVPAIFSFSLLSASGLKFLLDLKIPSNLLITVYCLLITVFSLPSFLGNYISSKARLPIPPEYFQLFHYLRTQSPAGRITNLPQGSYYGWTNYHWGNTGSGFLWYALPQPILDRAFDAWNLKNEQYYWELTTAIESNHPQALNNLFKKYSIRYIILDQNITFPDEKIYTKTALSLPSLLAQIPEFKPTNKFGKITVFESQSPTQIYTVTSPLAIKPFSFINQDIIFPSQGDYLVTASASTSLPYVDLFTNRSQSELTFSITQSDDYLTLNSRGISTTIPIDLTANLPVSVSPLVSHQTILADFPHQYYYRLNNINNSNLIAFNFPTASLHSSYLFRVDARHLSGLPLEIAAVSDHLPNKYFNTFVKSSPDWTTSWFIIPARQSDDFDSGLNFIFNNASFNHSPTTNDIKSPTLYPFAYSHLIKLGLPPPRPATSRLYLSSNSSIFFYRTLLTSNPVNNYLVLPQSFNSGWLAFYFSGVRPVFLTKHLLVNNWANGWQIPTMNRKLPITVYLLFWPQLLEFLGLALIFPSLFFALKFHKSP